MQSPGDSKVQQRLGVFYGILAFSAWGILPLYWKMLINVPAGEILAHRIVWSFVFVSLLLTVFRKWVTVKTALVSARIRLAVILCAILIAANWGIYIWAVNSSHIVDSSMGYYINPLLSVFLGMVFLRERLNFWQKVSLGLATLGVTIIAWHYGGIPWVSLSLAVTFGLYGLFKKLANLESLISLTLETAVLVPLALGFLIWKHSDGTGAFGAASLGVTLLLAGAGIVTAIPLFWFGQATRRVSLGTVGFTQYFSPTISLILGVFVYKESFTPFHFISFGLIWAALILYSLSGTPFMARLQPGLEKGAKDNTA